MTKTWTDVGGAWERWDTLMMGSMSAVDPWLIRVLAPRPGHRILDFGCGLGEPALAIAPHVTPGGSVLAIDLSRSMIAAARRRARARRITNATFRVADVARLAPAARFHGIVSRYSIMFPENVPGLLVRLRHHLRPRGRAAFAVWGPRSRNPYFGIAARAVAPFLEAPPPDPATTPHPLRFARVARLLAMLRNAGFRDVRSRGVHAPFMFSTAEQYAEMLTQVSGSTRQLLALTAPGTRRRIVRRLIEGAAAYRRGAVVRIPGFAWVVSARR